MPFCGYFLAALLALALSVFAGFATVTP